VSPLVIVVLLTAAPEPPCFVPRDTTPGWKHVTLPSDGPALAAPEGVDQFRADQPVEFIDEHNGVFLSGVHYSPGRTRFTLTPGAGACTLELVFKERLRGAKVDVTAWGPAGTMTLQQEERVPGSVLNVRWGNPGVREVYVTVHDHLRDSPVLMHWTAGCTVNAATLPVSDAYRIGKSLYYLQPADRTFALCSKPSIPMRVRRSTLPGSAMPSATLLKHD